MADAIVIVVRDPDASNDYAVFDSSTGKQVAVDTNGRYDGPFDAVRFIDVDLGHMDLSDPEEYAEWAEGHIEAAGRLWGEAKGYLTEVVLNAGPES